MNITTDLVEIPLVSLLDKALPETPTGYQCNFKSTGELTAKVKMGDKVFMRGGIIRLQSTSSLEVNTLTATEWLRAPSLLRFNSNRIKKNIFITEGLLNKYISIKEETVIYSVNEYIESLDFILPNSIYSSPEKLAKNIGCGKGLTPSGDDFLIGILAVLSSITEMHPKAMILYQSLRTAIQININKTNDISAHYLKLALSCHFSHPV